MADAHSVATFISVAIAVVMYFYSRQSTNELSLQLVRNGLLEEEAKASVEDKRVAVGFGGCRDVFVDAVDLFDKIGSKPPSSTRHYSNVGNQAEVDQLFAYFFQHGAAAERYVWDRKLFRNLVSSSEDMKDVRSVIGGNAPVMANRFAREGASVLLGSTFKRSTAESGLWKGVVLAGGDAAYRDEDDVHLVMEYPAKKQWGPYQASRANRFILHSDVANAKLESLQTLKKELKTLSANLLVVSGLQMMDSFPYAAGERKKLLEGVEKLMTSTGESTRRHFELASMSDESLFSDLLDHVIPYSDSLGMNEQELALIQSMILHNNLTTVSDSNPRLASALDQMRDVLTGLREREKAGGRRLTRLHVHTLAYQAIVTLRGSAWKNSGPAAAKAALTAFRHTCASDDIDLERSRLIMDTSFMSSLRGDGKRISVDASQPVTCWSEDDYEFCVAPVLVCTRVFQTAGGGDNISASGLVLQI
ncbi:ADP-dependent glucokinase-like [Sycon ciliatum]|uniref:ADP-dependent glucokinase-like n=1 Tax=Sycon ciliatum TaxID=27933 RepID=UPI0020ABEAFF|eukprot:scpid56070/ scgid8761/ ADP-dependent glucokinase